jgi:integrase/recombinase XerD
VNEKLRLSRNPPLSQPRSVLTTSIPQPQVREFLLHLAAERGLADNSLHAYRRDLENLHEFLSDRNRDLLTADARDLREYLQSQSRAGKATRTVSRRLAAIRVLLRYLGAQETERGKKKNSKDEILQELERPKREHSLPKVLNRSQVNQLISAPNPKSRLYTRDVAILELLYASGLRASELCSLKIRDLNMAVGVVRVMGKGSKERLVPVGKAALGAIEEYLGECRVKLAKSPGEEHLFLSRSGRPMERIGLWMLVEKYGRRSGLLKKVSPHTLRHCFATHLIGGGADLRVVQELLGHTDIGTTQIYTHVDQDRLKSVHRKFHPRG